MRCITFLSVFIVLISSCHSQHEVDLILHNAKIYTVDGSFTIVEALAVNKGKVVAVGKGEDILSKYSSANTIDVQGNPVYPGFIDAHAHFVGYGRSLFEVNLFDCKNWDEVVARVKAFEQEHPEEAWVRGRGWDQNKFPAKAYPDNTSLNELFPGKPVLLQRIDGHAAVANAKALELAGITAGRTITGGEIEIQKGKLTGVLIDNAVDLVTNVIPKGTKADYTKWLTAAQQNCFEQGLTTITDCGLMYYDVEYVDTLQREGKLQMRLYVMLSDDTANFRRYISKKPYKTDRLFVKGIKAYADGALGSRGACLLQPYADKPESSGFLLSPVSHFDSLAQMLIKTDFQLCTHAIGDSGNRVVLSVYSKYLKGKNDKRWRIEHAQVVNPADFDLFGKSAIIPSVQPTHATSDMYWAIDRLGLDRMAGAYAYKQMLQQNGWLPLGTDFPVEDISPVKTFFAAVIRKDGRDNPPDGFQVENALTREQTLKGMTIWAAKAGFMEHETGSLEKGKKADFVIMDGDLMHAPEKELLNIKVVATYVDGKKVFGR